MNRMHFFDIDNGVITNISAVCAPRTTTEYFAPNAKQYFAARGQQKPKKIPVRGWLFDGYYLRSGDEENGSGVAWSN